MNNYDFTQYDIIDAHAHIFPDKIFHKATEAIGDFYHLAMASEGSSDLLLKSGSEIKVSKYLVCSSATTPRQTQSINDYISEQCKNHSEFIGFGTLHPDMTEDEIHSELKRISDLGLCGIKLHPDFQDFDIDCKAADKIYDALGDSMPVLIHMGDKRYHRSNPAKLKTVLKRFSSLHVMAAHLGGYTEWEEASDTLRGLSEYLRFDTSSSLSLISQDYARKLILGFGIENCFWGSDFPMWTHESEFRNLIDLGFSEQDNRKIFSENFKNYFNI
ncbi:MAG: amidohydrolase family protein [Oscillospiraceae bacterium]|nr:amidohydrolase family protein [Oscillospiraceae bacterium]